MLFLQFTALMSGDEEKIYHSLCEKPLDHVMTLSANASVSIDQLRTSVCAINTTALMVEIQAQFNIGSLSQQVRKYII